MRSFEITIESVNSIHYSKKITSLLIVPDVITEQTAFALFSHGWGGNRFQHRDKMEAVCESMNRITVCVEYRQSGFDFDPVNGCGAYLPYDANFMQLFDALNSLRSVYELYPQCDRSRTVHYGGSQGGGLALLSAIFAPQTFAAVYASSPVVQLTPDIQAWTGRTFAPHELSVRSVPEHVDMIRCPLYLEHGTADTTVPHDQHTLLLEQRLHGSGKECTVKYYENGDHSLQPVITKLEAFKQLQAVVFNAPALSAVDDFTAGRKISIPCGEYDLIIDWSQKTSSIDLFVWQKNI